MKKPKIDPLAKLDMPETPEGAWWHLEEDWGYTLHLVRKKNFFKWQFGKTDYQYYGGLRSSRAGLRWPNDEHGFSEEILITAYYILDVLERNTKIWKQEKEFFESSVYLDDTVELSVAK